MQEYEGNGEDIENNVSSPYSDSKSQNVVWNRSIKTSACWCSSEAHVKINHVADERICFEELREKALSGQKRRTTYLDSNQELVMPEQNSKLGLDLQHPFSSFKIIYLVMSVKALGTSLKLTVEGKSQLIYPETWVFMFVVAVCVVTQMNYLNKHAADEQIRLEELREKVLSGK